jgi:Domain of unknown function (DUF4174)
MKKIVTAIFLIAFSLGTFAASAVVRPAPDFSFGGVGGRLSKLRGQPIVIVIARSADDKQFKKQAKLLRARYQQFSAKQVAFIAAFQNSGDAKIPSDIPWIVADDGAKVAAAFGFDNFAIIVIGKDGNVDMETSKITPAERVQAVLASSFAVQSAVRKGQ